jgi:hypothetical protein
MSGRSPEHSSSLTSIRDAVSGRNKPKTAPWVECPRPAPGRLVRPGAKVRELEGGLGSRAKRKQRFIS